MHPEIKFNIFYVFFYYSSRNPNGDTVIGDIIQYHRICPNDTVITYLYVSNYFRPSGDIYTIPNNRRILGAGFSANSNLLSNYTILTYNNSVVYNNSHATITKNSSPPDG